MNQADLAIFADKASEAVLQLGRIAAAFEAIASAIERHDSVRPAPNVKGSMYNYDAEPPGYRNDGTPGREKCLALVAKWRAQRDSSELVLVRQTLRFCADDLQDVLGKS